MSVVATTLLVAAQPESLTCGAGHSEAWQNVAAVQSAYARLSIELIRAASGSAGKLLDARVMPSATYNIFHGDVGVGPKTIGATGIIEFAKQINAVRFRYEEGVAGPISINPCGKLSSEIVFTDGHGEGVRVKFNYQGGRLSSAEGIAVTSVSGAISNG